MAPSSQRAAAHECLTDEALSHLKTYKYSSVDLSPISKYILKHYWNWVVELLPKWLAPNMVTLIGFMFILGNVALLVFMVPDMVGPAPSWVYWSFGLGVWMYSTMDNVDGKQARRTGTSSPLGELFDHGIDSLNCTLASLLQVAAMAQGSTRLGAFTAIVPTLAMFFSTWETYHTHTLFLGYFNGPTEGLLIASLAMISAGIWGPELYSAPLTSALPFLTGIIGEKTSMQDVWVPLILGAFFVAHLPSCVSNVVRARRDQNLPIIPVILEWTPILVFSAAVCAWLGSPHSWILKDNHLVLFSITMSMVFGRLTTKIILAHLTRQAFPWWTVLLTPLVGGAVVSHLPTFGLPALFDQSLELYYLWAYLIFTTIVYGRWAHLVITSICDYLGIYALTIPRDKWQSPGTGIIGATGSADLTGSPKRD